VVWALLNPSALFPYRYTEFNFLSLTFPPPFTFPPPALCFVLAGSAAFYSSSDPKRNPLHIVPFVPYALLFLFPPPFPVRNLFLLPSPRLWWVVVFVFFFLCFFFFLFFFFFFLFFFFWFLLTVPDLGGRTRALPDGSGSFSFSPGPKGVRTFSFPPVYPLDSVLLRLKKPVTSRDFFKKTFIHFFA